MSSTTKDTHTAKDKSELHSLMEGFETTSGWDVLVSYSQDKLNELLKTVWKGKKPLTPLTFSHKLPGRGKTPWFIDHYELHLEFDQLQFMHQNVGAWATLTMGIHGKITAGEDKDDITVLAPDTYILEGTLPITAITGKGENRMQNDGYIHFTDKTAASLYITFNFENVHTSWKILVQDHASTVSASISETEQHEQQEQQELKKARLDKVKNNIVNHLPTTKNEFILAMSLAETSNETDADGSDLLTPKSFRLASQPGVLNVFIQTNGGGNGNPNDDPKFLLKHSRSFTPIPKRYGASIVIARHIIVNQFLIKEITNMASAANLVPDGVKELQQLPETASGLHLQLEYESKLVTEGKYVRYADLGSTIQLIYKGNTIDFKENPLRLEIMDDPTTLETKGSWKWHSKANIYYEEFVTIAKYRALIPFKAEYDVEILNNPQAITAIGQDAIKWHIAFTKADQPRGKKGDQNVQINVGLHEFDLRLPELDYFRVTNVFAPGQHIIDAKDTMFPWDFVILGDVSKHITRQGLSAMIADWQRLA